MIVNPAPGAQVRHPATKYVMTDGAEVDPNDPYIARLLVDGDLVEASPSPTPQRRQPAPSSSDEAN